MMQIEQIIGDIVCVVLRDPKSLEDININERISYFKVRGFTAVTKTERIDWKTKNEFRWNDGTRTKDYPVINSHTYTMNGVGESNIGLLPEMKGSTVIIYGHYQDQVDSLRIFVQ